MFVLFFNLFSESYVYADSSDDSYDSDDPYDYSEDEEKDELTVFLNSYSYGEKTLSGEVWISSLYRKLSLNGIKVYFKYRGETYITRCNSKGKFRFRSIRRKKLILHMEKHSGMEVIILFRLTLMEGFGIGIFKKGECI